MLRYPVENVKSSILVITNTTTTNLVIETSNLYEPIHKYT